MTKVVHALAAALAAKRNCEQSKTRRDADHWIEMERMWADRITWLCRNHLPSGAGVDNGTPLDWDKAQPDRLVFLMSYHHMNDSGYCGWTDHSAIVTPSFQFGMDIRMTGRDRNGIKDYLAETLYHALQAEAPAWPTELAA